MTGVFRVLAEVCKDLAELRQHWALIGGIAVTVYTEPRTTRDVDVVVAVPNDRDAEGLVRDLLARGYFHQDAPREHEISGRLALVRLAGQDGVGVDLMFAFTGIETEIVSEARNLEVLPGLVLPVARPGHLLALKVYSNRLRDRMDGRLLILAATDDELQLARDAARDIALRNNLDDVELTRRLEQWVDAASLPEGPPES